MRRPGKLAPAQSQVLVLALHELASNAVKHGALSQPEGQVTLTLLHGHDTAGPDILQLHWEERGGPRIAEEPAHHGFGRRLLERGLTHQVGALVRCDFNPDGVSCEIALPLSPEAAVAPPEPTLATAGP